MKFTNKLKKINILRLFNLGGMERNLIVLLTIIIFVIINLLIGSIALRYDFSYGKAYTLSQSTKKIIQNIDDLVTIKLYASSDLPAQLTPLKTDVIDLINEYKRTNSGKIVIKIIDPKKDQKAAEEARSAGIPEMQFSQVEQDKYAMTSALFGIAVTYTDKTEIIPQLTNIGSLEYNITSAIYKMTSKELPKVAIMGVTPNDDPNTEQMGAVKQLLSRQFTLQNIDVSSTSAVKNIPSTTKALMVFDTGREYDVQEINAIKKYIATKGNVIFFVDGVRVSDNLEALGANHNLTQLLSLYGIQLQKNLLLSTASEYVNLGNQNVSFQIPYPFWLKTNVFNPKVGYFSNVAQLTFPWVSAVNFKEKRGVEQIDLVKTTMRSWEQTANFSLNPQNITQPQLNELKQFVIAVQSHPHNEGVVMVIPSSRFIFDRYLSATSGNLAFVVNVLNDLASGGALSGINQRAILFYQIPDLSETQKDTFKYANILLLPVLLAIFATIRLVRRK